MADLSAAEYYQLKHGNGLPNHPLGMFFNSDDEFQDQLDYQSDEDEIDNSAKFYPFTKEEIKEMQDEIRSSRKTIEDYHHRILSLQKTNELLKKLNSKLGRVEWTRRQLCSTAPTIKQEIVSTTSGLQKSPTVIMEWLPEYEQPLSTTSSTAPKLSSTLLHPSNTATIDIPPPSPTPSPSPYHSRKSSHSSTAVSSRTSSPCLTIRIITPIRPFTPHIVPVPTPLHSHPSSPKSTFTHPIKHFSLNFATPDHMTHALTTLIHSLFQLILSLPHPLPPSSQSTHMFTTRRTPASC